MGLGKWILIGAVVVGAWMFLVPVNIKCKVPIIGGGCEHVEELSKTFGVDPNAMPITQFDDIIANVNRKFPAQSNFARAQMLRGIY